MKEFLNNITTGKDNKTHDFGRVFGIISFIVGLGLEVYVVVWKGQPYSLTEFGAGVAAMSAGIGTMIYLKKDTEPTNESSS